MSKTFALDSILVGLLPAKKISKLQADKKIKANTTFYISVSLIAINVVMLASYIYGVNNYASKGYEIRVAQNKVNELNSEIKDLNVKVAKASSMVGMQSNFAAANFVPVGTPKFINVPGQISLK